MLNLDMIYEDSFEVRTKEWGMVEVVSLDDIVNIFDSYLNCSTCGVPHNKYTGCPKLSGLVTPPDFVCGFWEKKNG